MSNQNVTKTIRQSPATRYVLRSVKTQNDHHYAVYVKPVRADDAPRFTSRLEMPAREWIADRTSRVF